MADVVVTPSLDARKRRADFPILEQRMQGKALAYADPAASAQKPNVRAFVNATSTQGFSFHAIGTEGLNLVAYVWGQGNLGRPAASPSSPSSRRPR